MPGAAFCGLQAVFNTARRSDRHDQTILVLELIQQLRNLLTKLSRSLFKIGYQQISQGIRCGTYTGVGYCIGRQLVNKEDELQQARFSLFAAISYRELLHMFIDFTRHDRCLQQVG